MALLAVVYIWFGLCLVIPVHDRINAEWEREAREKPWIGARAFAVMFAVAVWPLCVIGGLVRPLFAKSRG